MHVDAKGFQSTEAGLGLHICRVERSMLWYNLAAFSIDMNREAEYSYIAALYLSMKNSVSDAIYAQ